MTVPIGVVTPLYNAAPFVAETARSVVAQLGDGDQYVVCDDGSTDGSGEIVAKLGLPIKLISQSNAGEVAAVNAGVGVCTPDIVGVVNADDPLLPGLISAVRAAFEADVSLAAVYPDWIKIDAKGRQLAAVRTYDFDYEILLAEHMCIPGPGAFFRRSVLIGEPVRDVLARGISDYDFWLRFGRRGAKIRRIPSTLATWRLHDAGTTITGQGATLAATRIKVIERLLSLPDLPDRVRQLGPRALSAAYYHAALVGLRATDVPSLRYAVASFAHALRWPNSVLPHQQRSMPHLVYASLQPVSGSAHDWLGPLLPPRYRRDAVLAQTFGLDVPSPR